MRVAELYGLATFQGERRDRVRRFGVPPGGAFDREAASIANALVGRDQEAACIELSLARLRAEFVEPCVLGIAGAPCVILLGGQRLSGPCRLAVPAGSNVTIAVPAEGARVYVAAKYQHAVAERRLNAGDELAIEPTNGTTARLATDGQVGEMAVRLLPGPHADRFGLGGFVERTHTIGPSSDRVGLRLGRTDAAHEVELPSEPAGFGAVQLTRDGTPIILGPDGPTIGGYPKIAHVISADWDRLGQLRPGAVVGFELVDLETARSLAREKEARLRRRLAELRATL